MFECPADPLLDLDHFGCFHTVRNRFELRLLVRVHLQFLLISTWVGPDLRPFR